MSSLPAALLTGALISASLSMGGAAGDVGPIGWPDQLGVPSHKATTVEDEPPGPAAMAWTFGTREGPDPRMTAFVLADDEDVYRGVQEAQDRSSDEGRRVPAPVLLSPDGRTLAVGASDGNGTMALIDLTSGERREVSLPGVRASHAVAFDLENGWLWVQARDTTSNADGTTTFDDWEWQRVDLATGQSEPVPSFDRAMDLAVVPGTDTVLVKSSGTRAQLFSTTDLEPVGEPFPISGNLEQAAVSPEGSLATSTQGQIRVSSVEEPQAPPTTHEVEGDLVVHSWLDAETLLVSGTDDEGVWRLEELSLPTGERSTLTELRAETEGESEMSRVSIATDATAGMTVREAGSVDDGTGGWQRWALLGGGAALLAVGAVLIRRRY